MHDAVSLRVTMPLISISLISDGRICTVNKRSGELQVNTRITKPALNDDRRATSLADLTVEYKDLVNFP